MVRALLSTKESKKEQGKPRENKGTREGERREKKGNRKGNRKGNHGKKGKQSPSLPSLRLQRPRRQQSRRKSRDTRRVHGCVKRNLEANSGKGQHLTLAHARSERLARPAIQFRQLEGGKPAGKAWVKINRLPNVRWYPYPLGRVDC